MTNHKKSEPIVLLAENAEGYSNLCRLVTLRQMGTVAPSPKTEDAQNDGRPITLEELTQYSKGVIALASLVHSSRDPSGRGTISNEWIGSLREIFASAAWNRAAN